jgi:nifR3 family TIM-barrel protein
MSLLKKQFALGALSLHSNIFYAPLAGCSDYPYRKIARKKANPGLLFCEMVKIDALVRNDPHTFRLLDYDTTMHPIGAQLCGSNQKLAAEAARRIEELGFDSLDYNCGCPVDKVTKDGSGSGMLKDPEKIGDVLSAMVGAVKIPVTVKIRAGWDDDSIVAAEVTQIAEAAGAKAITVHGRTREQGYTGPARWGFIRAAKEAARDILVIGNGDVFDGPSAERMMLETGCDGVLVARGTMGQPWIAEEIEEYLETGSFQAKSVDEIREALLEHYELILRYQAEKQALLDMRRVGCWYLKRCDGVKTLRMEINRAETTAEVLAKIGAFSWQEVSTLSFKEA